ncbi:MAG: PKD domain-containing protein, partial [Polaribacter sp.]|nr:PKD domain-containing protein [Polaribacter sp.]
MKLKKKLLTLLKNNVTLFAIIVFGFILFKSYANNENQSIGKFSFIPSATIKAEKNEICAREFMAITFEGSGGTAPYVFTYKINDSSEQTITSNNLGIAEINFMEVDANSYNYKLISVKDNNSVVTQIDNQEVTIIVNAIPVVDFTFNKNNVCAGELITFTPQVSGAGGFKYEWIFQDGVTSELESPSHSVEYFGCTTQEQTFRVTLTVFDKNGCQNSQVKNVTVTPKPDLEFSDADSKNFNNCDNASPSNPEFTINVANDSQSTCVDSYSIDWGDGNSESSITFPIAHTYLDLGVYTMKIRGIGDSGCFSELSYQVINIGKPVSDFSIAGNQNNVCLTDAEIDFEITNFETNSSDTTYTVDFGDGSTSETYTQDEIQDDNVVSHIYEKVSCSEPNGAFIATLSMQNLCSTTEVVVSDIKILESSIAEFESQDIACINSDIEFINKSFIGDNIDCNKAANFQWDFGDGTIVNDYASSVSTNQTHQYTNSGNFTVTLSVSTECGTDIFTKDICIEEVNTPTFALDEDAGCVPLNVTASNTTTENTVCSGAVYEWEVTYTEDNCETSASWSFADGTDKNSENPRFLFSTAGQYTIVQKIITGCGTATNSKIIEVKKPPTVNIDLINDACDSVTINPIATIQNCTSNAASITYNWTFVGGLPASANTLNPGNIFYGTPGTYEVTLEVTNDCGVSDVATQTFEVFEKPVITNTDLTQEICSNQSTSLINLTSNIANTTYSWSADASPGITGFIENGDSNLIPSQTLINSQNTSGVVTYTVIPKNNDCIGEGDAVEFVIIVNTSPRITSQPVSSEICESGAATLLEVAFENGTGIATYQWFSNSTDSNSDGNLIVGATNNSYIPPTDNFGELFYYAVISFSSGGCNQIVSNTASVNVLEQPKINPIDAIQNYCLRDISKELEVTYSGAT